MFDKKQYQKEYRKNNPDKWKSMRIKQKEYMRKYNKEYYLKNKEKNRAENTVYMRKWRARNPEKIKQINQRVYWNDREKAIHAVRNSQRKYPEKVKARSYVQIHKQRDSKCSNCNSTENLHFHHTLLFFFGRTPL